MQLLNQTSKTIKTQNLELKTRFSSGDSRYKSNLIKKPKKLH